MTIKLWPLLAAITALQLLGALACSPGQAPSPGASPTSPTRVTPGATVNTNTATEHLVLTGKDSGLSQFQAEVGDRLRVEVEVRQTNDATFRCARPQVKDVFGNTLVELSPTQQTAYGNVIVWPYAYVFITPEKGRYSLVLVNSECARRETEVEATVRWTLNPPQG